MNTPTKLTPEDIDAQIMFVDYHTFEDTCLTVCCITLKNGYNVIGKSGCIDPEAFDEQIGRQIARENAVQEIWQLEGYLLKECIYQEALDKANTTPTTFG
jgi:hypothetical protein